MGNFVIDIVFQYDNWNRKTPKEVGVLCIDSGSTGHWIIAQSGSLLRLTEASRQANADMMKYVHGLSWSTGDTCITRVKNNIKTVIKEASSIYCRGSDTAAFIKTCGLGKISDIANAGCPMLIELESSPVYCMQHRLKGPGWVCALNNVYKMKKWISENLLESSISDVVWGGGVGPSIPQDRGESSGLNTQNILPYGQGQQSGVDEVDYRLEKIAGYCEETEFGDISSLLSYLDPENYPSVQVVVEEDKNIAT